MLAMLLILSESLLEVFRFVFVNHHQHHWKIGPWKMSFSFGFLLKNGIFCMVWSFRRWDHWLLLRTWTFTAFSPMQWLSPLSSEPLDVVANCRRHNSWLSRWRGSTTRFMKHAWIFLEMVLLFRLFRCFFANDQWFHWLCDGQIL